MGREEEVVKERLRKIEEIVKRGVNPYPYSYDKKDSCFELQEKYRKLKAGEATKEKARVAGRVMIIRDIGKLIFADLRDDRDKIQIQLQEGETGKKDLEFFKKFIDIGDFAGIQGSILRTKRGELSILAEKIELLNKSIKPLPEKWHGLQDKEERYRKRYLDLIMNPEVKKVFELRARIIDLIREFLKEKGFLEVDTPYLQAVYGGAEAKPFKTHLNSLNMDLFLSISPELYLKRLIVGGIEKVFAIARNFRNEGIDRWHNPEFTMMEIYQAYADYNVMMELLEDLFVYICKKIFGTTKIKYQDKEIDFKKPWNRMSMAEAIKKYADINVLKMSEQEVLKFADKNKIECKERNWGMAVAGIFEKFCEDKLIQPTFIIEHPKETSPLCKEHKKDSRLIERFEPFCLGVEIANAYSELNDPVKQKILLEQQELKLKKGNQEANPYDEDFVNALEIGMPPTGGMGIGIDRVIMLLTDSASIRDVILFPFMKPEQKEDE